MRYKKFFNITSTSVKNITFLLILFTPLFYIQECGEFLFMNQNTSVSFFSKIGKDIGFILIIFFNLLYSLITFKSNHLFTFVFFLFCYLVGCSFFVTDYLYWIAGFRWCVPLFLIFALYPFIDELFMKRIAQILFALLFLQITIQILEIFFMPPLYARRYPGFFVYPSSAGLFANICLVFSFVFKYHKYICLILALASVIIAASATGVIIFTILIFFILLHSHRRWFFPFLLSFAVLGSLLLSNLDALTRRSEGDIETSGSIRMEILGKNTLSQTMFAENFGKATNTAMLMELPDAFIADSTYTAIWINLGWGGLALLLWLIYAFFYAFYYQKIDILLYLLVFSLGGVSIIIFEFFPINILFSISLAFFLRKVRFNKINHKKYIMNVHST